MKMILSFKALIRVHGAHVAHAKRSAKVVKCCKNDSVSRRKKADASKISVRIQHTLINTHLLLPRASFTFFSSFKDAYFFFEDQFFQKYGSFVTFTMRILRIPNHTKKQRFLQNK